MGDSYEFYASNGWYLKQDDNFENSNVVIKKKNSSHKIWAVVFAFLFFLLPYFFSLMWDFIGCSAVTNKTAI